MAKYIALSLFVIGLLGLLRQWWSIGGKEVTTGTVTSFITSRGSKGGTMYRVVASFADHDGRAHEYRAAWSSSGRSYEIGDPIRIAYDPLDPSRNFSLRFGTRFGLYWLIAGLGVFGFWLILGWRYGDDVILGHFPDTRPGAQAERP